MKLNEKIYHCRRKAGLSQEALAEQIGVSRQAISKWETGEASPEISKLPLLARTFGVTADWLLSEEDERAEDNASAEEPGAAHQAEAAAPGPPYAPAGQVGANACPEWVDKLPGFLSRMIRMYGWLVGVRMAIAGALFTAMGFVGRAMFSSMAGFSHSSMSGVFGGSTWTVYDEAGNVMDPGAWGLNPGDFGMAAGTPFGGLSIPDMNAPSDILTGFVIALGLVMLAGGILLAWYLKRWGQRTDG